ncbi:hypothetical protein PAXRUDRAFT_170594 [Paxillus rubicundulus Ve08.2h10]|uniref:Uncharacterized protein n=1 Tax=Paxillus rubicundulus Ve08.2h10 TaxID=930991 RepID=A0A0D0CLP7_9AGAM|nr:hypothetical protein PAXRUDRAFT_170594 [Paxillus rubicundulus Ve08.2h10]
MSGRGHGTSSKDETHTASSRATLHVTWEMDMSTGRTSKLLTWLIDHPVDCIVVFSDDKSAPCPQGKPSGRTKQDTCAVITEVIFKDDADWGQAFSTYPEKFTKVIQDCLSTLKKNYCDQAVKFMQTGNGVTLDAEGHSSLLQVVEKEFPWYSDLHGLWKGIPLYTPKSIINSTPGASQDTRLLALVQSKKSSDASSSDPPIHTNTTCTGAASESQTILPPALTAPPTLLSGPAVLPSGFTVPSGPPPPHMSSCHPVWFCCPPAPTGMPTLSATEPCSGGGSRKRKQHAEAPFEDEPFVCVATVNHMTMA